MKTKPIILFFAIIMISCSNYKPKEYKSFDDYPMYKGNDMELTYSPEKSDFCVWSPAAQAVELRIYENGLDGEPSEIFKMKPSENGTWRISVKKNLMGKFYTFQVTQNDVVYAETPGIWAKAVGVNGNRAAIIDFSKTNPDGWENDVRPKMENFTDAVIYELHYRDFSISETSGIKNRGKFLSLTEEGTTCPNGEKTGLDHLKELGVTHVEILPSYDFATIDETKLDENEYNWGYDPKNYNVPEGSYSTDPFNPYSRILEFKKMVQTLHQNGIRVIMDVVYNHTFDGATSHLNLLVPNYFYRFNEDGTWSNASGCGNETASERAMVRRFIVESVKYWVKEYHIDGFRFDLMGIHDIETMKAVRIALDDIDPTISIHGEGWTAGGSPLPEERWALKQHAKQFYPTAVFSDDIRDGMRGNWTKGNEGGFITGTNGYEESIKFGIVGATEHPQVDLSRVTHTNVAYAENPCQVINYVSCHDDPCLNDKMRAILPNATEKELIELHKLAQTIVLTSQGVPFIFAGEEVFRTKQGVGNSYKSPDSINQIDWNNKLKYRGLFDYYRDLILLRKAHPAFRMTTAKEIQDNLKFLETEPNIVAYTIKDHANNDMWKDILVIFNGNRNEINFNLPEGEWTAACFDGKIDLQSNKTVKGSIKIPKTSAAIFWKN